jgi:GNAT superfamily N-acetyltransferase
MKLISALQNSFLHDKKYFNMSKKDTSFLQFVDLSEGYNESSVNHEYLVHFYSTIMKKYFPIEDELDPIDVWEDGLKNTDRDPLLPELHVCLALDMRTKETNSSLQKIAGGCMFEYYRMSNCALLSYFVVTDEYQNLGLGRTLVEKAYQISKQIAHNFNQTHSRQKFVTDILSKISKLLKQADEGSEIGLDEKLKDQYYFVTEYLQHTLDDPISDKFYAFVAETNAVGVSDGIMQSEGRHAIMHRIGFRLLDFEYIQPPLSEEQHPCADLLLLTLHVEELPFDTESQKHYVQTSLLKSFMIEFLYSVFEHVDNATDDYLLHVLQDLQQRGRRLYLDSKPVIPWMRRTGWKKEPHSTTRHSDTLTIIKKSKL